MANHTATATLVETPDVSQAQPSLWRDYLTLTKPEISFLVAISSLAGFLLGSPGSIDFFVLVVTLVGVVLTSAGACALNHYLERELDAGMKRTAQRPLPAGRLDATKARNFGVLLILVGIGLVCPLVNPLTAVVGIATVVLYLFAYTPLKRKTKWNTLLGTVPGALPALGGWTAATNNLHWGGWVIFAILVTWQMPHFLSLAWMYRKDYGRANYQMLPVVEPSGTSTVFQTVLFTGLLLAVSLLPVALGLAGVVYFVGALLLGLWFLKPALVFYRSKSNTDARRVLKASVMYIPLLVLFIVIDWFVH